MLASFIFVDELLFRAENGVCCSDFLQPTRRQPCQQFPLNSVFFVFILIEKSARYSMCANVCPCVLYLYCLMLSISFPLQFMFPVCHYQITIFFPQFHCIRRHSFSEQPNGKCQSSPLLLHPWVTKKNAEQKHFLFILIMVRFAPSGACRREILICCWQHFPLTRLRCNVWIAPRAPVVIFCN